jgi:hypothetical protein
MMKPDELFAIELEVFRKEADSAIQFFYSYLSVNALAIKHKEVHHLLDTAPLFWNTTLAALQASTFIVLGRVFEKERKSTHNIHKLLQIAESNRDIFSVDSFAERRRRGSSNADEWLGEYLNHVYVPTDKDFIRLKGYVAKRRKIYRHNYRDIRNKFFAHKEISAEGDVLFLFEKTNIGELQKLLIFLIQLHETLWQLYHNGRKPIFQPIRYSVKSILEQPSPDHRNHALPERISHEIESFLKVKAYKS